VGSNLAEDSVFLRVIKIHSMTFFRWDVKPAVPHRYNLGHVKDPYSMKEILVGKIHGYLTKFLLLCY
jgi:hypothetical protein